MRRTDTVFKLLMIIWVFILLREVVQFATYYINIGLSCFTMLSFYYSLTVIGVYIGIFVAILQGNIKLVLIMFGIFLVLNIRDDVTNLSRNSVSYLTHISSYDLTTNLYFASSILISPIFYILYTVAYIISLVLYLIRSRTRHPFTNMTSKLGIGVLLANFLVEASSFMINMEGLNFLDIFLNLLVVVLFSYWYITVPNYMHD